MYGSPDREAPQNGSRPSRVTMSIQARSRPIVVAAPCPGSTRRRSSSPESRPIEPDHLLRGTAREVNAAPPAREEGVAAEQHALVLGEQADRALGVSGRVQDAKADVAEPDLAPLGELHGRHRRDDRERGVERPRVLEAVAVGRMDGDGRTGVLGHRGVVPDVIPVPVRADDQLQGPVPLFQRSGDPGQRRGRRVDGDRLARRRIREDVDVGCDRPDDRVDVLHDLSLARRAHGRANEGRPALSGKGRVDQTQRER